MDMYTGKFIGLIKERQMRFEGRLGEHLAELEAKWEEKLQLKQNIEMAKRKVADVVVVSATTDDAISNWMEAGDATATYVTQGRAGRKIKEEVATGEDAGTTCAAEPDPIFSFHGDSLLGVDINE